MPLIAVSRVEMVVGAKPIRLLPIGCSTRSTGEQFSRTQSMYALGQTIL